MTHLTLQNLPLSLCQFNGRSDRLEYYMFMSYNRKTAGDHHVVRGFKRHATRLSFNVIGAISQYQFRFWMLVNKLTEAINHALLRFNQIGQFFKNAIRAVVSTGRPALDCIDPAINKSSGLCLREAGGNKVCAERGHLNLLDFQTAQIVAQPVKISVERKRTFVDLLKLTVLTFNKFDITFLYLPVGVTAALSAFDAFGKMISIIKRPRLNFASVWDFSNLNRKIISHIRSPFTFCSGLIPNRLCIQYTPSVYERKDYFCNFIAFSRGLR